MNKQAEIEMRLDALQSGIVNLGRFLAGKFPDLPDDIFSEISTQHYDIARSVVRDKINSHLIKLDDDVGNMSIHREYCKLLTGFLTEDLEKDTYITRIIDMPIIYFPDSRGVEYSICTMQGHSRVPLVDAVGHQNFSKVLHATTSGWGFNDVSDKLRSTRGHRQKVLRVVEKMLMEPNCGMQLDDVNKSYLELSNGTDNIQLIARATGDINRGKPYKIQTFAEIVGATTGIVGDHISAISVATLKEAIAAYKILNSKEEDITLRMTEENKGWAI